MPDVFPAGPPVIDGPNGTSIINLWLRTPPRVQRTVGTMADQRFVGDLVFGAGPVATGGAVVYDQVLASDLYMDPGRDVTPIEPGSEFPQLTLSDLPPLVARAVKWGGAALITYEEQRRDNRDQVQRKLLRLRNNLTRKVNAVSIATLRAAPLNAQIASGSWAGGTANIFNDVATGQSLVDALDMGYDAPDTALVSVKTALNMLTNTKLQNMLPRETTTGAGVNPILAGRLTGVAGITRWIKSNQVGDDEVFLLNGRTAGSISDEVPLYTRVVDRPESEATLVMAGRIMVPYVTDPKSVVRITGVQ